MLRCVQKLCAINAVAGRLNRRHAGYSSLEMMSPRAAPEREVLLPPLPWDSWAKDICCVLDLASLMQPTGLPFGGYPTLRPHARSSPHSSGLGRTCTKFLLVQSSSFNCLGGFWGSRGSLSQSQPASCCQVCWYSGVAPRCGFIKRVMVSRIDSWNLCTGRRIDWIARGQD